MELLGDPPGAKMAQDAIWDASGALFGGLFGRILAPRWAKMAPSWPTWRPRCPTWRPRWPTWRTFGSILATFFGSWARSCQKLRKPTKTRTGHHFERFFPILGAVLEAKLVLLGAMLGHVGAILEQLGDEMGLKSAKMSQESGEEHQDEPRWRN